MSSDIRELGNTTFPQLLLDHAAQRPTASAVREKHLGIWQTLTWAMLLEQAQEIAAGLHAAGFKRGENLALIGDNRPSLCASMIAVQALGGVAVPMYQDAAAQEMVFVLQNAEIRFAIVEDQEQVDKLLEVRPQCPEIAHLYFDDPRGLRVRDARAREQAPRRTATSARLHRLAAI